MINSYLVGLHEANYIQTYIDGYQHSFLLPKLMILSVAPDVLTTLGTLVTLAGGGMLSKRLLS